MPTTWAVTPTRLPLIIRRCHQCGHHRFDASGAFRINANGKLLDVWLLALCTTCGLTTKLSVLERTHVRSVPADLLDRLHRNDSDLVAEVLQWPDLAHRNHIRLDWDGAWTLDTGTPDGTPADLNGEGEAVEVAVRFDARIPVRPVRLIATGLSVRRAEVERLLEAGRIVAAVDLRARLSSDFAFMLKR